MSHLSDFYNRYGPWALVAGASTGIGQAYAHALAERGINLVTLARRRDPLVADANHIRSHYQVDVEPICVDLSTDDLARQVATATKGKDIGLLVYNACYSAIGEFVHRPLADHLSTIDVNCRGPVTLACQLAPELVARGSGGIILMSSMAGFQGSAMVGTYAATKSFNTILAESLWAELSPQGVDVLACVAGATLTPDFQHKTPDDKMAKAFPMQPAAVVQEALAALGRKPVHVVGRINRLAYHVTSLMSRRQRTRFFSKTTRSIYQDATET